MKQIGREDWSRPLASVETLELPVRRARQVFYLTGTVLFGGLVAYVLVASGDDPLAGYERFAFHVAVAGLVIYAAGAVRLYYGLLTGRSRLTVGPEGIRLGDHLLKWADIQDITLQPTSPALRYLRLVPPWVRIQARQRTRHLDVTRDHVKDLEGFASWLSAVRSSGRGGGSGVDPSPG